MSAAARSRKCLLAAMALIACGAANAGSVTYLANEAVLVESGGSKILFDPLFTNGFGQYRLLPQRMHRALFAGEPPFDDVAAIFISHHHADHFAAGPMAQYLHAQPQVRLYAPAQAVTALRDVSGIADGVLERVTGIALDEPGVPVDMTLDGITIAVMRVPHSGWPNRMTDVENLVFRITLDDTATVAHFGDADPDPAHFTPSATTWQERDTDLAMPPYWFFLSDGGRQILDDIIRPKAAVGVHVPVTVPRDARKREERLQSADLFIEPGESRPIP